MRPSRDEPSGEEGATASEYAIVAALIAVVIAVAVGALGITVRDLFQNPTLIGVFTP